MFILDLSCAAADKDFLIADLWEHGPSGIIETDTGLRAFFEDDAEALRAAFRDFDPRIEPADDRDWVAAARERLQPMLVGARFFLVPEWRDDPAPDGRFRIVVNPGLAFGTGAHETTRLCLEMLEREVKPGMTVVDIGTGSGILAEAAVLLGASRVVACDIDPQAVEVARGRGIPAFIGSADAIASTIADIVVANISPEWIAALAPHFFRILRGGGQAILSGFEAADLPTLESTIHITETRAESTWRVAVAFVSKYHE